MDNITNHQGKLSEYYDENKPGKTSIAVQSGRFSKWMYQVDFK